VSSQSSQGDNEDLEQYNTETDSVDDSETPSPTEDFHYHPHPHLHPHLQQQYPVQQQQQKLEFQFSVVTDPEALADLFPGTTQEEWVASTTTPFWLPPAH
jgi:hypothetical protein